MDSAEPAHVLDYYVTHYRPGMVDLSTAGPSVTVDPDEQRMGYAPPGGLPALREAIAGLYPGLAAEHIVVTNGATEALAATAFALVRPSQRVSVDKDVYPSFRETASRLGAIFSDDSPALAAVNNPTVPDGRLKDLRPLIAALEARGGRLVADEVYLDLRADAPGTPAALLSSTSISIGDLSKPLGLGGLRIGWAACRNEEVVAAVARSVQLLSGGPSILAMEAGLAAVSEYEPRVAARSAIAAENAPLLFAALEEAAWDVQRPQAGWTFLARPPVPLQSWQLQELAEQGLFLVPGSAFGVASGYRISVFAPVESLRAALRCVSTSQPERGRRLAAEAPGSLVILAKSAEPGIGKTRLAKKLGTCDAAELAGAFLRDTLDLAHASGLPLTVAFTPAEARAEFASLAPGAKVVAQLGGNLGQRIAAALAEGLRRGAATVLIGSDTPHLPASVINDSVVALQHADLVVGPATDGGFYLVGIRKNVSTERLFHNIEWSTSAVFGQLLANARKLGLTFEVMEEFTDIDDAASLASVLCQASISGAAPHTRATAARLGSRLD
jgi:rSAM/selenodomain-associated transferase 1